MGEDRTGPDTRRLTVAQAADQLGISEGAVRNRIKRDTLRAEREAGRVYVLLAATANRDRPPDESELVAVLREQLAAERQAHAEARRLLMAALERIPPQLEAPSEVRESDVSPDPTDELGEAREELGAEQTRREMAESTLHEGMAEERRRREEAERERDELRRELFALRDPRESPQTVEEEQGRGDVRPEPHATTSRPWRSLWRRMFGS